MITALVNYSQLIQITQETNHLKTLNKEVDHHNKGIHEISHKTDTVDQVAKITSIETTIHDQIPIQHNLFLDPVPNQTQGIDTIPIINDETHHTLNTS